MAKNFLSQLRLFTDQDEETVTFYLCFGDRDTLRTELARVQKTALIADDRLFHALVEAFQGHLKRICEKATGCEVVGFTSLLPKDVN